MATKQQDDSKDDQGDTQHSDAGGDEQHARVKTPTKEGEHPPGMGEDEDESYVPEKRPSPKPR